MSEGDLFDLHICMIAREFPPKSGGIGYYVLNLSKKLRERGHRVTVVTRGSTGKIVKEVVDEIEVFKASFFPLYPFHIRLHGLFVNMLLKSLEPKLTLVHLHTPLTPPINTVLPVITTVHTPMKVDSRYHEVYDPISLAEKMQSMYVSTCVESKLLKISSQVTAVSPSVANELREYGLNPSKVVVTWNGVDEKVFYPVWNKEKSKRYVLYTGVLRARKGLFDLIRCARLVSEVCPDVEFVVCGSGPLLPKLREQVRGVKLQKRIVFLGAVERKELIKTYQNATIQVVPSIYEGLPTVLLEAMACGLPVVATNIGGNRDVISSGVDGLLVPPGSPEEMARVITMLWSNESLRERIGKAARETILQRYTWDRIANNFVDLYESMLRK